MMIQQSKQQHQENAEFTPTPQLQQPANARDQLHHPAQASNGKQHKASAAVMKG